MALLSSFKKGTTFEGTVYYVPKNGNLSNLIGATISSKIKDSFGKRHTLACVLSADGLSILVTGAASVTKDFNIGQAYWDVKATIDGKVIATATFQFEVQELISTD